MSWPSSNCPNFQPPPELEMTIEYTIPDLLATWPWPRRTNPFGDEVKPHSDAWLRSLQLFKPEDFKRFEACNFTLLASHVAPTQSKELLRIACDLMYFYFAIDEYTDSVNNQEATEIAQDIVAIFRGKSLGTSFTHNELATMAIQFFNNITTLVGEDSPPLARFVDEFEHYLKSVIQEAEDRESDHLRTVESYLSLRRDTCGARPSFALFALGLNIPDEVWDHPTMKSLLLKATDLFAIVNDMHSYGLEYSRQLDGHNILTALMYEKQLGLQGALQWLHNYAMTTISQFLTDHKKLPTWGAEVDKDIAEYVDRIAGCVRGYDSWSYETMRYYGRNGLEVARTRRVNVQH